MNQGWKLAFNKQNMCQENKSQTRYSDVQINLTSQRGHFQQDSSEQRGVGAYSCSTCGSTSGQSGLVLTLFILTFGMFLLLQQKKLQMEKCTAITLFVQHFSVDLAVAI